MAVRVRPTRDLEEFQDAVGAIGHYFGSERDAERSERFSRILPLERMHAAWDGTALVGGAGVLPFELTVPGGSLPCAGVTVVGVLPTHRRRGVLNALMRAQLADVRERGEPLAALWASEETIYGRFGYGLASISQNMDAERSSVAIRRELPRDGSMRLVAHDEALRTFPRLYERVGRSRPGMIVRTRDWWSIRRLDDRPETRRGGGPLVRALLERDGKPVGYALYRLVQEGSTPETWTKTIRVGEALGVDDAATRDIWRFLLQIDWTDRVTAYHLPVDHPLPLLVDRINKLRLSVWDALWLRVVDVPVALAGRTYGATGPVTVEVASDPHFPENVGRWTIEGEDVRRGRRRPDVRVAIDGLGSAFLGGISFAQLARAGQAEEGARGGIERADAAFRASAAPWCPEIF